MSFKSETSWTADQVTNFFNTVPELNDLTEYVMTKDNPDLATPTKFTLGTFVKTFVNDSSFTVDETTNFFKTLGGHKIIELHEYIITKDNPDLATPTKYTLGKFV